jgi:hypothetical protein
MSLLKFGIALRKEASGGENTLLILSMHLYALPQVRLLIGITTELSNALKF